MVVRKANITNMDEFDLQPSVLRLGFLKDFHCDSSVCIENCCNKYSIVKIDKETYQKYEDSAPEVAKNIKYNDEKGYHEIILGEHFACPFYGDNLCSVQCKYGEDFLSETCAFYPRVFRRLNNLILVSATCACSEITKQAIFSEEENFNWEDTILKRIKKDIIDFMPTELRYNKAELFISWHDYLLKIFNITELSTDELLMKYIILSEILDKVQKRDWVLGYNLLVRSFENHSVEDEIKKYKFLNKDMADAYGIALLGTSKGYRPSAFAELVYNIVDFLNDDGLERYYKICEKYIDGKYLETVLKRYLKTKFYETVYPICNWKDCSDELLHIITNYIGIKLNFAIYLDKYEQEPDVDTMINIITQFESAFYNQRMKIYEYYKNVKWDNYDKIKSLLLCWYK